MKLKELVVALSTVVVMNSAIALNDDGTGSLAVPISDMKLTMQDIVQDRLSVVEQVLASDIVPETGAFSDRAELRQYLMQVSDDMLARAFLAMDATAFRAALLDKVDSKERVGSIFAISADDDISATIANVTTAAHAELIYTPITPCRIFDTRSDSRGPMGFRETRAFAVNGSRISNQGGDAGDCPTIPFDPPAVVVTLTATNATDNNFAVIWEANEATRPGASTVNYTPASPIANTTITPVCISCGAQNDVQVYVRSTAQVVGDVVGYFQRPQCPSGQVKQNGKCFESGTHPAASFFDATATCASAGGRLPTAGELCQLVRIIAGPTGGEHSDSVYVVDGSFRNMRIADGPSHCTLVNLATTTTDPYRCVKPLIDE